MSLPSSINLQDDNFFIIENLAQNPDNLYLYSIKDTDGLSDKLTYNTFNINLIYIKIDRSL